MPLLLFVLGCSSEPDRFWWSCACDENYAGRDYYYTEYTEDRDETCATHEAAQTFSDEMAADCRDRLIGQGFTLVSCDCYCDRGTERCDR